MSNLAGINLAMQTPFNEDGSIDYAEWEGGFKFHNEHPPHFVP